MRSSKIPEPVDDVIAYLESVLLQSFVLDDIKHCKRSCTGNGIAAKRIEISPLFAEVLDQVTSCHDTGNWMPVAHWFAQRNDVGHKFVRFEAPEMCACAAEAGLDFICYE